MNITSFFVRNNQFTLVVFLMIIAVSVFTLLNMPRAEDPEINAPRFPIIVVFPGTSPLDLEELVVRPIESKLSELDDIKRVRTDIEDDIVKFDVEYNYSVNPEDKYQELVREIEGLRSELPEEILSIHVRKISPTDVSVLQVALVSENASESEMWFWAEQLTEELELIKSLKRVKHHGIPERKVMIQLDMHKLAALKIPPFQIIAAIQSEAANIPAGRIYAGSKFYNVKTSGPFKDIRDVEETIVFTKGATILRLKDIAEVTFEYEEPKHKVRVNGKRAAIITAAQKAGENIAQTQKAYLPVLDSFSLKLPPQFLLVKTFDQANNVAQRLGSLGIDFMIALTLVLITLLPLGWRAALIVMCAIPLSLGLGIVSIHLLGFSLNQLSIVGLVVALGLLVDDSIVVVENIERWLREGNPKSIAVVEATKQITLAVIGTTATLVISFIPIAMMPESSGEFIRSLPLSVMSTVFASMLVSLTIIPFLASRLLKTHHQPEGNFFLRILKKVIHKTYFKLLNISLKNPITTLVVATLLFVGSLFIFGIIGFKLFPSSEKPQFLVNINLPAQTRISATDSITRWIENEILKEPEVQYITSNIGNGNPRIYYNEIPLSNQSDYAQLYIQLNPEIKTNQKLVFIDKLRKKFNQTTDAKVEIKDFEQGPPIEAPIALRIKGENLDSLRNISIRVQKLLESIPGAIYINNDLEILKTDLKVDVDREKAKTYGISLKEVDQTIRMAISGLPVASFTDPSNTDYDVLVTGKNGLKSAGLNVFESIYVTNIIGQPIPLKQFAKIVPDASPSVIKHLNRARYAVVTAFTANGVLTENIVNAFQEKSNTLNLPPDYELVFAGEAENQKEAFGDGFIIVIIVSIFLFIMVLILEFKTFKSTLIVLSVIPLGIIGGISMLWITGNPLSFVAIVGFIALAGIEVKNSILLVDFTNQLRAEGMGLEDAIREAGELRFLPIILTTLTAIGGLIPIALNSNPLISPLAIVLIGGLISSTLLSRIVTPVVYKLIPPKI
jgi:multidrug efflux pump subunit AcrB